MSVRWDAVVERDVFPCSSPVACVTPCSAPGTTTEVSVWLFGRLGGRRMPGALVLELAEPCLLRDVVRELGRKLGPGFLGQVLSKTGAPRETCRVSLGGVLVRDLSTPVVCNGEPASVEIILFSEIEGG